MFDSLEERFGLDGIGQATLGILLLVVALSALRPLVQPEQPAPAVIVQATPTQELRPVPTLMPTPVVIYVERPAAPSVYVEDNSVNVCVGFCPGGR